MTAVASNTLLTDIIGKARLMIKPALMMSLAFLAQSIIVTTDILMIGWLGVEQLAGSGFVVRFYMPCFLFALGLVLPITPLGGEAVGAKKPHSVRRVVQQSLWTTIIAGVILTVVLQFALQPLLNMVNQPQSIIDYATEYGTIFLWSIPLMTMATGLRTFMNVVGRTTPFMILGFAMVGLNVVLDYWFIFGGFGLDAMGVSGAALATIFVNTTMVVSLIIMVIKLKPYRRYRIFKNFEKIRFDMIFKIGSIGLPMSFRMVTETLLISFYYISMSKFGASYLAGYQVAFQMDTMAFLVSIGISLAISANVGYAKGKKDSYGMLISSLSGMALMTVLLTLFGFVLYASSGVISSVFILGDTAVDIQTREILINMLLIIGVYQFFHALYFSALSAIDGMGEVRLSSFVFLATLLSAGISLTIILSNTQLGAYGVLIANVSAYSLTSIPLLIVFVLKMKKYKVRFK